MINSATVRDRIAGSGIRLTDRGLHQLKGVPGTHPLVAVDTVAACGYVCAASGIPGHPRRVRTVEGDGEGKRSVAQVGPRVGLSLGTILLLLTL